MPASPKYQVFISSTYEDLREERDQVIKAVLEMGHIPVGMEMFSAADEQQWQIIARHIDESDYYAVVIAHRLGSLTPEGISFTRKEYEYARSKGIPCLGFIIDASAQWPGDRIDKGQAEVAALTDFKSIVREKPVGFWTNAEDLHGKFSIALMKSFTAQPMEGWVRASSATGGAQAAAELVRLSAENGELRRKLAAAEASAAEEKKDGVRRTAMTMMESKRKLSYRYRRTDAWVTAKTDLLTLFEWMGPEMVVEASVVSLARDLAMQVREDREKPWDIVATNQVKVVLADFLTLGLVRPSMKKHAVSDDNEYWSLSEDGIEMLKLVRRIQVGVEKEAEEPESLGAAGAERESDQDAPEETGDNESGGSPPA